MDGESGSASDVEVRKLAECALYLEGASKLAMEGNDTGAASYFHDMRSIGDDMIGDLLKMRSRILSRTERTEFMPSSPNPSDGFTSLIAPGGGDMSMRYVHAYRTGLTEQRAYHFKVSFEKFVEYAQENAFQCLVCME